ncbi:MAG: transglycosylase SLT domain-containing protein [Oenococcus sp.]|uniref:transglycosylase SLT domain-containing protein n=1 Tax=Oenococcus sp. TaxID=1979414 RepID=UPI0039E82257
MELEELEVLFKVNTAQIQPMLDKMQSMFEQTMGKTASTAKSGMQKTEDNLTITKGLDRMSEQLSKLNNQVKDSFGRLRNTANTGSQRISESAGNMFSSSRTKVGKDLDSMVAEINAKMGQARAAQAKMRDLTNQRSSLSMDQQMGSQGVKFDNQIATAQAQMTRYQTQAKALAQSMRSEFNAVPDSLSRIAAVMDRNEGQINGLKRNLGTLSVSYRQVRSAIDDMGHSTALDRQSSRLERSIFTVQNRIDRLVGSNDSLNKSYAYVSDRGEALKGVVGQLNTELGSNSSMAMKSSSSMRNMGNSMNNMGSRMRRAGDEGGSAMDHMATGTRRSRNAMTELAQQVRFLPAMLIVYGLLYQGIMNLATGFGHALMANKDFANSLNQIQVNLLTAFYPIYTSILPAVNAMMAALSKATGWIASFVSALTGMGLATARSGAKGLYTQVQAMNDTGAASREASKQVRAANQQIAKSNREGAQAVRQANDQIKASNKQAQDAFEATKKKNQELAQSLMGFDEINVLDKSYGNDDMQAPDKQPLQRFTPQSAEQAPLGGSGTASGSPALNFNTPIQQSQGAIKAVQDLKKLLGELFDPMMQAWQVKGQKVVDSAKYAWNQVLKLLGDVDNSFLHVWDGGIGEKIWTNIFDIIADVFKIIGNLAGQFDKAWNHAGLGNSIFKTLLGMADDFLSVLDDMAGATVKWSSKLNFTPLLQSVDGVLKAIRPIMKDIWNGLDWGYQHVLLPLAKFTIEDVIPDFLDLVSAALKAVGSIINASKPAFTWFWNSFLQPLAKWTGGAIVGVLKTLTNALSGVSDWVDKHHKAVEDIAKALLTMFAFKVSTSVLSTGTGFLDKIVKNAAALAGNKDLLKDFFGKITGLSSLKDAASNIKDIAKLSWSGVKTGAGYIVTFVSGIKNWSIWSKIAAAGQRLLNAAMSANPIVLVITAITALVAALVWFFTQTKTGRKIWSDFMKFLQDLWQGAVKWFGKVWDDITSGLNSFGKGFQKIWNGIGSFFGDIWKGLKKSASSGWDWIANGVNNFLNGINKGWRNIWNGLSKFWGNIWNGIKSTGSSAWNWVSKSIGNVLNGIDSGWRKMWKGMGSFFGSIWDGIKSTVKRAMNGVIGFINSGISGIDGVIHAFGGAKHAISFIPHFEKGTPGAPKGLAMVNDGGGQEAIIDNQQNVHVLQGKNQLVNFEGGETVIPYQASKSLLGNGINHFASGTFGWLSGFGNWIKDKWESITKFIAHPIKALQSIAGDTIKNLSGGKGDLIGNIAPALGNGLIQGISAPFKALMSSFKKKNDEDNSAPAGHGVARWRDDVEKALRKNGLSTSASMINKVLRQIQTESGGNEKAVQGGYTDINTISGDLAKGLMQTISATFNHYKFPGHGNIFNGYDNLLAALAYAKNRYGSSLSYLGQGHGYENGGLIDQDNLYRVGEGNKAEMVIPLTNKPRALELIQQALSFMGETFGAGLQIPTALSQSTSFGDVANTQAGQSGNVRGGGINELGSTIVNALVQGLQMSSNGLNNNQSTDLHLTIQIGNETIGNAAIAGINTINQRNGRNMLKL